MMVYSFSPTVHKDSERMDRRLRRLTSRQIEALRAFSVYCVEIEPSNFVRDHAHQALAHGVFQASVHDESHSGLIMFLPHSVRVMMGGRDGETDGRHQDAGARIIPDA